MHTKCMSHRSSQDYTHTKGVYLDIPWKLKRPIAFFVGYFVKNHYIHPSTIFAVAGERITFDAFASHGYGLSLIQCNQLKM